MEEIREQLANLCHEQWSGWMEYLFSKCHEEICTRDDAPIGCCVDYKTGNLIIPKSFVERWTKQTKTDYKDLSEEEKESDRKEADKFLQLLKENSGQCIEGIKIR